MAALVALLLANGADAAPACVAHPVPSATCFRSTDARCRKLHEAACFTVRARLSFYNGAPSARLWPLGSKRVLGVHGADGDAASPDLLPQAVRAAVTPASPGGLLPVTADFTVCPLAQAKAGRMQPVCIQSAAHLAPARP